MPTRGNDGNAHRLDIGVNTKAARMTNIRPNRYRMSSDVAALGADFYVLSGSGEHAFKIDGRSIAEEDAIRMEDLEGHTLYLVPAQMAQKRNSLTIFDVSGSPTGMVERRPVSPLRDRFSIVLNNRQSLAVSGIVPVHEYVILGAAGKVAEVSQRWFRAKRSFGVEIAPGQPDALLLTSVLLLDLMASGRK